MSGATAFDEDVAAHYEAWYETEEGQRADALEKGSLRQLLERFPDVRGILEVGCGTGHFTRWVEGQGISAVGLDLSAVMLAEAQGVDGVALVQADAHRLPFADGAFDVTMFVTTLEFLSAPRKALGEAVRVGARGVVLGVLNRWSILALRRRLVGLFRPTVYETARFYSVGELRGLLYAAAAKAEDGARGDDGRVVWHTTLFPRWVRWKRAQLACGGLIAMALLLPDGSP